MLFLSFFLVLPAAIMAGVARPTRLQWTGIAAMLAITALVGIPWDQWMAAQGIWHYDPRQVLGAWVGYVPLEEVIFILLMPVLAGLWVVFLENRFKAAGRAMTLLLIFFGLTALAAIILGQRVPPPPGAEPSAYLVRLLAWTIPLILMQIALGGSILFQRWRIWLVGVLGPVIFLSLGDVLALGGGIWVIAPQKMLHYYLPGRLPLEEALFFLTTVLLIVQGLMLFISMEFRERAGLLLKRVRRSDSRAS